MLYSNFFIPGAIIVMINNDINNISYIPGVINNVYV